MKDNRGTHPNVSIGKKLNPAPFLLLTLGGIEAANEESFEIRSVG